MEERASGGGECGRYESRARKGAKSEDHFRLRDAIWQSHMSGVYEELKEEPIMSIEGRPSVGMQRALHGIHTSVLVEHFFYRLGFRLVLTPPTTG